jgi:acyl carrier protein
VEEVMEQLAQRVNAMIGEQLGVEVDDLVPEANLIDDLGADSLDVVELAMAVEEEFGLEVPDDDLENIRTVKDIVDYIRNQKGVAA